MPDIQTQSLPFELSSAVNQAYFLHVLAVEPGKIVPPGKSLLSMMTNQGDQVFPNHSQSDREKATAAVHNRVESIVHTAFWNQATEALSSSSPSIQVARLKGLFNDVLEAAIPLFPPNHQAIQLLSSPLPPTSSPLLTTVHMLRDILCSLKERCAPIRDSQIDELLSKLDDPLPPSLGSDHTSSSGSDNHEYHSPFASRIVEVFRSCISLIDDMKADLNQFVLGAMSEDQLCTVVVEQAMNRERQLILDVVGRSRLDTAWESWLSEYLQDEATPTPRSKWMSRLVKALHSADPISCNLAQYLSDNDIHASQDVVTPPNNLPPHFFFCSPSLFYIQNYLQALVIASSLRVLVHIPSGHPHDFVERVWGLLKAEIDEVDTDLSSLSSGGETKITNLVDEVIRCRQQYGGEVVAQELRDAVERTLRTDDPVFRLLQKRELQWVEKGIEQLAVHRLEANGVIPLHMRTGLDPKAATFRKNSPPTAVHAIQGLPPPGFEDPILAAALNEITLRLYQDCIQWTQAVWIDAISSI
ncbi:hypothetical protein FISHEDRAFT_39855 [Fistulina hepatica ATCC 64428]|uniref:Uncharacterized protein n=1 Tax=Fistulina hepatica ATCC 64428 TaxID=1128425 RepID=A0A0D7AGS9_9AGAR|nr:hypothetical protein FISHEDRAFT_39855 [Fistulina hepatica ATCC 64428]